MALAPTGPVVAVFVVPLPPLVRRTLRVTLGGVLPNLLPPKRGHVQEVPGVDEYLVAATVDEVRAEDAVTVADECVGAVPFVHAEVDVKPIGHGVPRDLPAHPRLHARELRL